MHGSQSSFYSEPQRLTWWAEGSPVLLRRLEDLETATDGGELWVDFFLPLEGLSSSGLASPGIGPSILSRVAA